MIVTAALSLLIAAFGVGVLYVAGKHAKGKPTNNDYLLLGFGIGLVLASGAVFAVTFLGLLFG